MSYIQKDYIKIDLITSLIIILSLAFIMFLPVENYGSFELVHSKLIKMVLILGITFLLIINNWRESIKLNPLTLLLICYMSLTTINLVVSSNQVGTLIKWGQFLNITLFIILFSQKSLVKEYLRTKFPSIVAISTLIIFTLVIFQLYLDILWPQSVINSVTGKEKPVALFNNTNGMSGFLVLSNLYLLWFLIYNNFKVYYLFTFLLGIVALYLGESMGAYLSFTFGTIFLFLYKFKKIKIASFFVILLSFIVLLLTIFSPFFLNIITNILEKEARYALWYTTILIIKDYWLTGIGNYNFNNMLHLYGFISPYGAEHPHPHNIFLDLLVTYGIVGLIISILILFTLFKYLFSSLKKDHIHIKLITVLLFSSLLRDVIDGGFLLGTSSVAIYLYLIVALYSD